MKRIIHTLFISLIVLLLFSVAAAEDVFDYRNETNLFCRKVSELNRELDETIYAGSAKGIRKSIVVFQTSIIPLRMADTDFQTYSVVYGPKGFSVLICSDPEKAVSWLLAQDGVFCAEIDEDVIGCSESEEETEHSFRSWGADKAGFGTYIDYAKKYGTGAYTIAVVDSGVSRHALIEPKVRKLGYDYIDSDEDPTNDLNGHGTHVAGIIADCTDNLPINIYPIRVLDETASGKISNVISAIMEAIDAKVDIINLSLSTSKRSESLENAIRTAISSGVVVVAAAGNDARDTSHVSPGGMPDEGIIIVGSADQNGSRSGFSNYGDSVDLYFYGRSIESCSKSGGFAIESGTSMAAPHISSLCAMMKMTHPSIDTGALVSRMRLSSTEQLCIPSAKLMVPQSLGFQIEHMSLRIGDVIPLPLAAAPATAMETIRYTSNDENVVRVENGILKAIEPGHAGIFAVCGGLEDAVFEVDVYEEEKTIIEFPSQIKEIQDEAFFGTSIHLVILGDGIETIGNRVFDGGLIDFVTIPQSVESIGDNDFSNAVILCEDQSWIQQFAIEHQLQYITIPVM